MSLYEDEKNKKYIEALESAANIGQEDKPITDEGNDFPQVDVGNYDAAPIDKPYNQPAVIQDMMEAAKYQTQADTNDFQANREQGDREMLNQAMENGYDFHFGGPYNIMRPIVRDYDYWVNNVEDNAMPSGYGLQIPNTITNRQTPEDIQRQKDEENRRLRYMGILDGIEELKRMQAYNT